MDEDGAMIVYTRVSVRPAQSAAGKKRRDAKLSVVYELGNLLKSRYPPCHRKELIIFCNVVIFMANAGIIECIECIKKKYIKQTCFSLK